MPRKTVLSFLLISLLLIAFIFSGGRSFANDISVLFSPGQECGRAILERIDQAENSIDLAMYHLTSRVLSQALVKAVKRGVRVRAFLDGENALEYYSKAQFLKKNGVLVKLEQGEGLMHQKFCIIDNALLITGSYNWTTSADLRNDENVMFVTSKEVVRAYRVQFEKYWIGNYVDVTSYTNKNTLKKR